MLDQLFELNSKIVLFFSFRPSLRSYGINKDIEKLYIEIIKLTKIKTNQINQNIKSLNECLKSLF